MKLADVSIRRPVFAVMMIGALVVLGIFSYPQVGVDLFPKVDFPIVTVTVVYPGADPAVIEKKVADKVEEAVSTINGIKRVRSVSLENVGQIFVEFELDIDGNLAAQDVRDKVARVRRELPREVTDVVVEKFDIGAAPVLSITVAGRLPVAQVTAAAKKLKEQLQKVRGVGGINLVGGREREIHVYLKRSRLQATGLSVDDVSRALRLENLDVPAGRLTRGTYEFSLKTKGEVSSLTELGRIVVRRMGGRAIRIEDVADVVDTIEEGRSYSELDGLRAVALVVRKRAGGNTVAVARRVRAELAKVKSMLPKGVTATVPMDNSPFVARAIHDVQFDLLFGGILAVVIVFFFLADWRATIITAIAIPTSVVATFAFIRVMGFTFNNMTMLALSLSIGILIDDAIVVVENIYRHLSMGKRPDVAAAEGTGEIGLAVMATTFAIVAVFLPVAFMKGMIGQFFYEFGLTVSVAVLVSLLVSFTLTPMMSSRMLRQHEGRPNRLKRAILWVLDRVDAAYAWLLRRALRRRWVVMLAGAGVIVLTFSVAGLMKVSFLPQEDRSLFQVLVELPEGKSLDATRKMCAELSARLRTLPEVHSTLITVGGGSGERVNRASIQVKLKPAAKRQRSQAEVEVAVRKMFAGEKRGNITVQQADTIGGGAAGFGQQMVQFNLRGDDLDQLADTAKKIIGDLKKRKGFVDLDYTYRAGKPEYTLLPNRERAALLGVPVAQLGTTLRTLVAGEKVTDYREGTARYDVRLRLQADDRRRPQDLGQLMVRNLRGQPVRLSEVARVGTSEGPAQIQRQDRQRQVTVLANLEGVALGDAIKIVDRLAKKHLPKGVTTSWAGQAEMMKNSLKEMALALLLAIIFVYMILASQFNSLIHPITIMLSVPFSVLGAIYALVLTGMSFGIFAMIGLIMLMGLVTKAAILLVDFTNQLREQGMPLFEALVVAGRTRLRPIVMTTGATIFGMLPVALAFSEGGEARAPMAISVIGGLITSTLLTLVVVPVVYSLLDRFTTEGRRERKAAKAAREAPKSPAPASPPSPEPA